MNVLLIRHPTTHFRNTAPPVSGLPLGILYVASCLRNASHQVSIYDAIVDAAEDRWGFEERPGMRRMGATWEEIAGVVADRRPDVVGIGNPYTSQVQNAIRTAEVVKQVSPSIRVVVGGPHATVMPSSFLYGDGPVDYVVMGEGERTMVDLLESIMGLCDIRAVKGVAWLENGQVIVNEKREFIEDLDALPMPAYDLVDMERYFLFNGKGKDGRESCPYPGAERSVSFITSRGCPFNCIFCSIHLGMGRRFRANSVDYVLNHIRHLRENHDLRHIHFEDDNLTLDMGRFEGILDGMRAGDFPITWDTPNGVRADFLNRRILEKCRDSGCTYMRVGVESANEHVRGRIIGKQLDLKRVIEVAGLCNRIGIDLEAFYIVGFPGETIAQMRETMDFALRQERLRGLYPYGMFTATPLVGTELYNLCVEKGYISRPLDPGSFATATQGEGMISTADFSPRDLAGLLKEFRIRHLIAWSLFSLKFLLKHPQTLFLRLKARIFLRFLASPLSFHGLFELLDALFLFRYKNCVIRKIRNE